MSKQQWIVGIDEVGRGPLAGPVCVCGVLMDQSEYTKAKWRGLTDSKKLSHKNRELWYTKARELEKDGMIRIGIASRTAAQIDKKGIGVCIKDCITTLLADLGVDSRQVRVLLDGGLRAPEEYAFQQTIIKGDLKHKIISLASVVAKVTRDAYMVNIAPKYSVYDWQENKGYGTRAHISSIKKYGATALHRKTFLKRILDNKQ